MRPTLSIILFTVLSGAGYGLWMLAGIVFAAEWPICKQVVAQGSGIDAATVCSIPGAVANGLVAGLVLVVSGLLASVGHLGQPRRAWRAFSQWRTSWLSREGIASLLTFLPAAGLAIYVIALSLPQSDIAIWNAFASWIDPEVSRWLGFALVSGSFITVYCTANIYACLKPVRAWNNLFVAPAYLFLSLYSGMLFLWLLNSLPSAWSQLESWQDAGWKLLGPLGVMILSLVGAALKLGYWKRIDQTAVLGTGDATGLASLGRVRSFEQPHTEENYLTQEMGFRLARRHSRKLRLICLLAGFGLPGILALLGLLIPGLAAPGAWLAVLVGMSGIFVERWLFFAEAKHTVMLYYGARST